MDTGDPNSASPIDDVADGLTATATFLQPAADTSEPTGTAEASASTSNEPVYFAGQAEVIEEVVVAGEPDDLTRIEGIGPKIAELLVAAEIRTFTALANADVDTLRSILADAGSRYQMHDPGTWPEQAGLAAAGDWDALDSLQDRLDGGR